MKFLTYEHEVQILVLPFKNESFDIDIEISLREIFTDEDCMKCIDEGK